MFASLPTPEQKRSIARGVGRLLEQAYGRRLAYAPARVVTAMRQLGHPQDWDGWALSLYASLYDFISYYSSSTEIPDYEAMRNAMLRSIGVPVAARSNPPAVPPPSDWPLLPEGIGPTADDFDGEAFLETIRHLLDGDGPVDIIP